MQIQMNHNIAPKRQAKNVQFGASIPQAKKAVDAMMAKPGCKCQVFPTSNIVTFFEKVQAKMKETGIKTPFKYELGRKNKLPASIANLKIEHQKKIITPKAFDEKINETAFKCKGGDCQADSLSLLAKQKLSEPEHGLANPHILELNA